MQGAGPANGTAEREMSKTESEGHVGGLFHCGYEEHFPSQTAATRPKLGFMRKWFKASTLRQGCYEK